MKVWNRGYGAQFFIAMGLYTVSILVFAFLMNSERELPIATQYLLALMPTVPVLLAMRATVLNVRSLDELEQRIHLEAVVITLLLVGTFVFSYGMMELAELVPDMPLHLVFPLMIATWGITSTLVRRRFA